jgi:apolipoprotein N-acyltransferase
VAGIPLILNGGRSRWSKIQTVVFGVGLAMAVDVWIYLIVTDGSNASYLLPVSFYGSVMVVGLACAYVLFLNKPEKP